MQIQDLTMREMRDLQRALGLTAGELEKDAFGLAAGMAWLIIRKDDPEFTFEDALDMTQAEVSAILDDAPKE